ncbi:hypothetical protein ROJ8625_00195 [Roseivivax jejudonensis]|uniref:Chain length determinant protein n=1 Tax=Roseivivax jejudonensis TaxID=1529041 RepID=A0A1X6Y4C0_9RHOB|nr:hypothetical protein [Roseivivax jejudonensis]SLN10218.1 hypothetical protein ROJ8625_00195 [Roseivivax jejudonensis]
MPSPRSIPFRLPLLVRLPFRQLSLTRVLRGGRPRDLGRLPRYVGLFALGAACIWGPITSYLQTAPLRFTSSTSLILPGSGASASVNLDRIGQASSFANSPFASNAVSPTETYKRLLGAGRIVDAAAETVGLRARDFGQPRVELVDQTGLIHVSVTGASAEDARARGAALLDAFFTEIDALRTDEVTLREDSGRDAIEEYRQSVLATRDEISRLQRETGLISAGQYTDLVAETEILAQRVRDLTATLDEKTESVAALERALGSDATLAAAALRLHADTEFAALNEERSVQAAALSQAEGRYGANHPEVRAARAGHEAARTQALARAEALTGLPHNALDALDLSHVGSRADLLSDLVSLEAERAGLSAELAALSARLETAEARKIDLIEPAARLEDLQRDFSVAEAVFASAMARTQTSKTDLYASYPLVQVLEDPSLPTEPSSPKRKLALAAGVAATLFLLMGLFLGWLRRPLINRLLAEPGAPHGASAPGLVPAE